MNVVIEVASQGANARPPMRGVGIDLGLKDFATLSSGEKIEAPRIYRNAEGALALAQRARKMRRIKAIHARIANRRNDFLHKLSDRIVQQFDYVAVGNVSAARLAKTSMAKSVLDVGWSTFRNQLAYKAIKHGAWFEEVDESFTSQICSDCGAMPDSRPKGIADLGIREWQCSICGGQHDRDLNAAINILRRGRATLAVGISALLAGRTSKNKQSEMSLDISN